MGGLTPKGLGRQLSGQDVRPRRGGGLETSSPGRSRCSDPREGRMAAESQQRRASRSDRVWEAAGRHGLVAAVQC